MSENIDFYHNIRMVIFRTLFVSSIRMVKARWRPNLAAILLKTFENRTFVSGLAPSLGRFINNKYFIHAKTV
jgi:hypothetical protein